jgi:2-oxoglutarate/2-oxoacid ferredoxin oxidoreductase subunit alpha
VRPRSRKLAALARTLKPPRSTAPRGRPAVVGWGSTLGAIEEAVDRLRAEGARVSALHLRFLSPMEPGLEEIFARFRRVMTVEINYSDDPRRPRARPPPGPARQLLRERTLVDVDCWSRCGPAAPPGDRRRGRRA